MRPGEFASLTERWSGRSDETVYDYEAPAGRVPLLTCECRDWGCGGIAMHVAVHRGTIKWFDLSSPDGTVPRDVGPFVFAWEQFKTACERTAASLSGGRSDTTA